MKRIVVMFVIALPYLVVISIMGIIRRFRFEVMSRKVEDVSTSTHVPISGYSYAGEDLPVFLAGEFIGADEIESRYQLPRGSYKAFALVEDDLSNRIVLSHSCLNLKAEEFNAIIFHELGHTELGHIDPSKPGLMCNMDNEMAADAFSAAIVGTSAMIAALRRIMLQRVFTFVPLGTKEIKHRIKALKEMRKQEQLAIG